jgi:hypothetical protein
MSKKLMLSCMALVAFAAFVLPATALGANDPQLTDKTKVGGAVDTVAVGSTVVGTAANTLFTTTEGATLVTCSTAKMTGTVKKNSASTVEGEIPLKSAIFQGTGAVNAHNGLPECTGSFGSAYITVTTALCVISNPAMVNDEFQVTGGACGTGGKAKFIIGSTTAGACEYETTGAVKGTFNTGEPEAKLTTTDTSAGSGSKLLSGGFLCPPSGALAMTFTLETTDGSPMFIS